MPKLFKKVLWGNRERWGLIPNEQDSHWKEWQNYSTEFYMENQRSGIGAVVNDAGYTVMQKIDLSGKKVLELGAGDIRHIKHWKGVPSEYILADISESMMQLAKKRLDEKSVEYRTLIIKRHQHLAIDEESIDVIISFYSLEHLYPLMPKLEEYYKLLSPGGILIGAVPAEGGMAWGFGRMLTSRRWLKKNTSIDPDKIICWEHPNFSDHIIEKLDNVFQRENVTSWPFPFCPLIDINLIFKFLYLKPVK
tara:strand:+ start:989 stop:1738 length:750 start_codon:yes stop_codon:yes gene_type:complete